MGKPAKVCFVLLLALFLIAPLILDLTGPASLTWIGQALSGHDQSNDSGGESDQLQFTDWDPAEFGQMGFARNTVPTQLLLSFALRIRYVPDTFPDVALEPPELLHS